jgi:16S rRNA (guanine527-N7)-methyltransferase
MRPLKPASGWPVADVSSKLGVALDATATTAIDAWLDALAEWNAKMDLTAAKDARALAWLMLADAMVLSKAIATSARVIDVGTGAGAPGLALAIMRRDLRVTLCEPLGKRAAFLRSVIGALGLEKDVALEAKRGEDLAANAKRFDVAISRATLAPSEWLALGATLVEPRGNVWVMLAQDAPPTHEVCTLAETLAYEDDATGAKKTLVRYAVTR